MQNSLLSKLEASSITIRPDLALMFAPSVAKMPLPIRAHDDPFFPFGKAIIDATADRINAYIFNFASYLSLGAAGVIALERTIAYANDKVTILHGPFCSKEFSVLADDVSINVDAITVSAGVKQLKYSCPAILVINGTTQSAKNTSNSVYSGQYDASSQLLQIGARTLSVLIDAGSIAGQGNDYIEKLQYAVRQYAD